MDNRDAYVKALIDLHRDMQRQGPGDTDFSAGIIEQLPELPARPVIADLGCGAGAGALLLAQHYGVPVKAVDFAGEFLEQMMDRAARAGIEDLIEPLECDIGRLEWEAGSLDLLWSEGAAYNLTFSGALARWRPLLRSGGIAVISEMNYFASSVPEVLSNYMAQAYPGIGTESANEETIMASGFALLSRRRLPAQAWWDNYYNPLCEKMAECFATPDAVMQSVLADTEREMDVFRRYHDDYGYTYYVMRAVQPLFRGMQCN